MRLVKLKSHDIAWRMQRLTAFHAVHAPSRRHLASHHHGNAIPGEISTSNFWTIKIKCEHLRVTYMSKRSTATRVAALTAAWWRRKESTLRTLPVGLFGFWMTISFVVPLPTPNAFVVYANSRLNLPPTGTDFADRFSLTQWQRKPHRLLLLLCLLLSMPTGSAAERRKARSKCWFFYETLRARRQEVWCARRDRCRHSGC